MIKALTNFFKYSQYTPSHPPLSLCPHRLSDFLASSLLELYSFTFFFWVFKRNNQKLDCNYLLYVFVVEYGCRSSVVGSCLQSHHCKKIFRAPIFCQLSVVFLSAFWTFLYGYKFSKKNNDTLCNFLMCVLINCLCVNIRVSVFVDGARDHMFDLITYNYNSNYSK